MVKTAPHWGQHEVIEAYYRDRHGPEEKLIAYQMNWKGENFYTGNRVPAFVSSGAPFTNYIRTEKEHGAKVMYFITEHSRIGGLKSEVGAKSYKRPHRQDAWTTSSSSSARNCEAASAKPTGPGRGRLVKASVSH